MKYKGFEIVESIPNPGTYEIVDSQGIIFDYATSETRAKEYIDLFK